MILKHEKINYGSHPLIETVVIKPPFRLSFNFPNEACFIYFKSGDAKINAPYEQQSVQSKNAVLLRCGTYFSQLLPTIEQELFEILVFHLPKEIIKNIYTIEFPPILKSKDEKFIYKVDSSLILKEFINGLQFYFNNPAIVNEDLLKLKIQELMLLLMQTQNAATIKELLSDTFSPIEVNLKQVVNSHIFSNTSVNDLAVLCNQSPSSFNRNFKKIFNDTPSNYFKTKRLEKAKSLLQYTSLTISEIAFKTCFYDTPHFSKSYKEKYGHSPNEYRNEIK